MDEYNLSFHEAIDICLLEKNFIVGENFAKGCYGKNSNGVIVLVQIAENKISHNVIDNMMITTGLLKQKFKTIVCANSRTLGII